MKTTVVNICWERADVICTRPGPFGNQFRIGLHGNREEVIRLYRQHLRDNPDLVALIRKELGGKILGCVCKPKPCHVDVIAAVADGENP